MQKVKLFSLSAVVILLLLIINCAPSLKKYYDCRFEKTSLGIILPDTMQLFFGFKGKRASLKEEDSVLLLIKDRITAEIDSFTKFGKKSVITIKSKNCKSLSVKPHGALSRFSVYDSLCYLGSMPFGNYSTFLLHGIIFQ